MTRLTLSFTPLGVLIFRDYRGFDAGQHHEAATQLPTGSAMRGCVRGALFRLLGADFRQGEHYGLQDAALRAWLGGRKEEGTLRLRGPWLGSVAEDGTLRRWYTPRLDRDGCDQSLSRSLTDAPLQPASSFLTVSHPAQQLMVRTPGVKARGEPILDGLDGRTRELSSLVKRERRVGIARDPALRTVEEGLFYFQDTLRFCDDARVVVELDCPEPAQEKLVRQLDGQAVQLGGRGQYALLEVLPASPPKVPANIVGVRFTTPLVLDPNQGLSMPNEEITLAWICTDDADVVGGFDLGKRQPRPLHTTLPAGTVLGLDGVTDYMAQIHDHTWGQPDPLDRAGYGATLPIGD